MNASWYGSLTLLLCIVLQTGASAQSGQVTGIVSDPTGAVIANALVALHGGAAADVTSRTDRGGRYNLVGLTGREYVILALAPGFAPFGSDSLQLLAGKPRVLDIRLKIAGDAQQVTVLDSNALDTDPNHNGDSLTLTGRAINDLPLDPAQLLAELQGLSGGLSPDIYVDGFSGGKLPPRDTIREIRINQNPYSALNDTSPGNGQIQIFTKPGSNKFHGDFFSTGNASVLNTRNEFAAGQPPYYSYSTSGGFSGPIGKRASFFLDASRQTFQTNALVDAQTLDANNNQVFVAQAVSAPNSSSVFSTRVDLAPGKKSTLIFRYSTNLAEQVDGGIGQLALPSQGFNNHSTNQTIQVSNSQIVTEKIVNDTRFQYTRSRVRQVPMDTSAAVNVAGAFNGGGSNGGEYNDNQDRYELQNYVSATAGKLFFTFGARFRDTRDANHSTANYNGSYTFASLALSPSCTPLSTCSSYQVTEQGLASGLSDYQIRANGGGASQFGITQGNPNVAVNVADGALFLQDDWKAKPNFTLSAGLRFETQNHIADHADWAPRLGFAWALKTRKGKPPVYMVRGGVGLFYGRFTSGYVLQAARQNGVTQQQYLLTSPSCFPDCNQSNVTGARSQPTIYQVSPAFHAPYSFSGTASIERQINTWGSVTLTYLFGRGVHTQLTRNINAPLPGTYDPAVPTSGVRPLGGTQNIYEYDSAGLDFSNRLTANFFFRFQKRYLLYGFYQIRSNRSDASGGFPSNQYDLGADYGRATTDFRHSAYIGASTQLPFGIEVFSFIRAQSGTPYDITVGQDLNGDSIFNDRPAFATDLTRPSVVQTPLGNFDTSPIAGQTIIPRNYGHGPGLFLVNLNFNREFRFGPEIKPAANAPSQTLAPGQKPQINHRYGINFGFEADNVFNQVNLAQPIGTLNSPLFGHSIALNGIGTSSANRVIQLQTFFSF